MFQLFGLLSIQPLQLDYIVWGPQIYLPNQEAGLEHFELAYKSEINKVQ